MSSFVAWLDYSERDRRQALEVMVFGQPRQEDLLHYLMSHVPADRIAAALAELRLDLGPR